MPLSVVGATAPRAGFSNLFVLNVLSISQFSYFSVHKVDVHGSAGYLTAGYKVFHCTKLESTAFKSSSITYMYD